MHHLIDEIMTTAVAAVEESTPFKEITRLLDAHHVSGVPVVDRAGRVVGVVAEADLLKQQFPPEARGTEPPAPTDEASDADARGPLAADLMTSPPITVGPTTTVAEAAGLMLQQRVNRLPVVDAVDHHLVGIVTRSDLLKVFNRSDGEIRREIIEDVILRACMMDPGRFRVRVEDGIVTLEGRVERRSLIPIFVDLVRRVDGVVHVRERLGSDLDDRDPELASNLLRTYSRNL
jgi:CBS domain-containing protein